MNLKEQVYSVLIVSAAENINASLKALLPDSKFCPVHIVTSVNAAKRTLLERSFDFIVVNSPLPDGTGTEFAIDAGSRKNAVVLLLVKNELYAEYYEKVVRHGVFVLSKPTSKQIIIQALDWMTSARERLRTLEQKTLTIEEKMEEIRLVNRAKWLLIDELKMTESDAHRYIEKQAMDRCVSKREIAETIIKMYS